MSETRMTDEAFEQHVERAWAPFSHVTSRRVIEIEARRARAAETDLAAQLENARKERQEFEDRVTETIDTYMKAATDEQARAETLRSERDAAREALAAAAVPLGALVVEAETLRRYCAVEVRAAIIAAFNKISAALSPPAPKGEATKAAKVAKRKPVCERCGDTHAMALREREVPCTFCPIPCQECRQHLGAYCGETPCRCACHAPTQETP